MFVDRLNRLCKMPGAEIKGRARQEALKLGERFWPPARHEMTDRDLLLHLPGKLNLRSPEQAAEQILSRLYRQTHQREVSDQAAAFFPSLRDRTAVARVMQERFPAERSAIIRKADRACLGLFDLMGFAGLSFGNPIDWQWEPVSGRRTPLHHWSRIDYLNPEVAGDKKITWELNRHGHFVTLGQAYWMTGDERYSRAFAQQLTSWMDANPPGTGINWASSLELALRLISWLWALHLFSGSEHLSPSLAARLLKFVLAHARHIDAFTSHYFSPNTHLTGEALGLLYCGAALPELDLAAYWRERSVGILLDQLPIQVLPDGVYFERSTYYHRYTADFYTHLLLLARGDSKELDDTVTQSLIGMLDHLMWMTRPDGRSALAGDDDGGRLISLGVREPDDFRDTLSTGAAILGRGDWKHVAGGAAVETLWLLGPAGLDGYESILEMPPAQDSKEFPHGGFYVMRDGWEADSTCAVVSCGRKPLKPAAHLHSDALSFEFAAAGAQWLVDPGTFTYTGSAAAREALRSAHCHNTAVVDGVSHSESSGPFSWRRLASGDALQFTSSRVLAYFLGSHDGYTHWVSPVRYARQFALIRSSQGAGGRHRDASYLVISDDFDSKDAHTYEANFILDPVCSASVDGKLVVARHPGGSSLEVFLGGTVAGRITLKDTQVSRCYGKREAAPAALVQAAGSGPQQLVSVMIPAHGKAQRAVEFKDARGQDWVELKVTSPDCEDHILIANTFAGRESQRGALTGTLGFTRRRLGVFESAVLVGGDRLVMDDISIVCSAIVQHCEVTARDGGAEVTVRGGSPVDLEVRIAGQCHRLGFPGRDGNHLVSRCFDLSLASGAGTGK